MMLETYQATDKVIIWIGNKHNYPIHLKYGNIRWDYPAVGLFTTVEDNGDVAVYPIAKLTALQKEDLEHLRADTADGCEGD